MTTEITQNKNPLEQFKATLESKLKQDIGSLLPDDCLKQMVEKAIEQEFFKSVTVHDGYHTKTRPSWFCEQVKSATESHIKNYVLNYMDANKDIVKKLVDEYLGA